MSISGVVFTHELNNGSPYYVIIMMIFGQTDTVTSGGEIPIEHYMYMEGFY